MILCVVNLALGVVQLYIFIKQLHEGSVQIPDSAPMKVFFISLFILMTFSIVTKMFIIVMNAVFSRIIFQLIKKIEAFIEEIKK